MNLCFQNLWVLIFPLRNLYNFIELYLTSNPTTKLFRLMYQTAKEMESCSDLQKLGESCFIYFLHVYTEPEYACRWLNSIPIVLLYCSLLLFQWNWNKVLVVISNCCSIGSELDFECNKLNIVELLVQSIVWL